MTEKDRENIALFRYGIIAPILNGQVSNQTEYLAEVCSQVHQVPYYGPKEFAPKTISCWLLDYRRGGFDGLKPKRRSDRGQPRKLNRELEEHISKEVSYSTIYRLLKNQGMIGRDHVKSPERKRFSYDTVNTLWQGDMSVGPYLIVNGKKLKTFLFAFIDDCSRVIPFAQFCYSEKFDSLKIVFKEALIRRGIPKIVYVDNGKIYRSDVFHVACASLGIALTHTQPYDAASKGKIERFFGTVKTRFFPLLRQKPASSLDELNQRFWRWLEEDYHRKIHASLGMTPQDMFLSQVSRLRMVDDPASLDPLFLKRDYRKVKHDGTISIDAKLYEVSPKFIGQRIEVRYDETGVYIYKDGILLEKAVPVNFSDNAHVKRERSLSFRAMSSGKEPGAGKTFALRSFAESLNPSLFKVIYFPLSTGTVMDFYRGLAVGLGEDPKFRKVDLFHQIQHAIQVYFKERKITPVFILDEMQLAKDMFLNDLNILFNFSMDSENPFILILSGLPHLMDKLSLNHNRPLSQRIMMRYKVEPLSKDEVKGYILHHLELAGAKHTIFSDTSFQAIASLSRGWPRLINKLATHSLLAGCQAKKDLIDEEVVRLAATESGI